MTFNQYIELHPEQFDMFVPNKVKECDKPERVMTFGEARALHPERYDIFTPTVKEFDTPGKYRVVLPGSENENEYMDIEVFEDGCYNVLNHVVEPIKSADRHNTDK